MSPVKATGTVVSRRNALVTDRTVHQSRSMQ